MHEACSYSGEQVLGRRCSNEEPPPAPCRAGSLTQGQLECSRGSKEPLPCRLQPTVSQETADRPVGIPEGSGPGSPGTRTNSRPVTVFVNIAASPCTHPTARPTGPGSCGHPLPARYPWQVMAFLPLWICTCGLLRRDKV